MKAERSAPRPLGRSFWIRIGAAVLFIFFALWNWITSAPENPVYNLVLMLIGLAGAAQTAAEYTTKQYNRNTYLVLLGVVIGLMLFRVLF